MAPLVSAEIDYNPNDHMGSGKVVADLESPHAIQSLSLSAHDATKKPRALVDLSLDIPDNQKALYREMAFILEVSELLCDCLQLL